MVFRLSVLALAMVLTACPDPNGGKPDGGTTPKADGGPVNTDPFEVKVLDPEAAGGYPIALAISGSKIGVSYWVDAVGADGGAVKELRYVENSATPKPEVVARVARVYGASLAYDHTGTPSIAYLGPPGNQGTYWYEACADVATRGSSGSWTSVTVGTVFDMVMGLHSAIAFEADGTGHVFYRDINNGQFTVQGAEHSHIGYSTRAPGGGWSAYARAVDGSNRQAGHGGMTQLLVANGQPTAVWSGQPAGDMDTPRDVWFMQRKADKTWPADPVRVRTVGNTVAGPQLAWKQGAGYAIVYDDRNSNQTKLAISPDGVDWAKADEILDTQAGTGGWYPSVGWTPEDFPAVAFYNCSVRNGQSEPCPKDEDELVLAWLIETVWQRATVDKEGGHWVKLGYSNGRAVVAYKDVADKTLKLAIQR